jgi:hypothetical protein
MSTTHKALAVLGVLVATLMPMSLSRAQLPPPPCALVISSTPPGADISVNGIAQGVKTNGEIIVTPGTYSVQVSGGPGNLQCSFDNVSVAGPRSVIRLHCPQ